MTTKEARGRSKYQMWYFKFLHDVIITFPAVTCIFINNYPVWPKLRKGNFIRDDDINMVSTKTWSIKDKKI